MLYKIDPSPIKAIAYLKQQLAQNRNKSALVDDDGGLRVS